MGAGPEPSDEQWLWLAVESAARALAESGPDEAITVLWDCFPARDLAADDLDHRVALACASDHPSAVCTKFSGDSPIEYQKEEIWYSDDAGAPG